MKTYLSLDIEGDSLWPERVWCVCCEDVRTGETWDFLFPDKVQEVSNKLQSLLSQYDYVCMHNGIEYDWFHLLRLNIVNDFPFEKVLDTLVLSRLENFNRLGGHSLEQWGLRLGYEKIKFDDYSKFSQEMLTYCQRDVTIQTQLVKYFLPFLNHPSNKPAIELEHKIARVCHKMHLSGFYFDRPKAEQTLAQITEELDATSQLIKDSYPPELKEVHRIQYRVKKNGELMATTQKALDKYPKTEREGQELVCYDYVPFNPASSKQRIEKLWQAGWKPIEKTNGRIKWERDRHRDEAKRESFEYYGWKCNERNLSTLPVTAPVGANALAEWLTMDGRRSDLQEWLDFCGTDSRIHGRFMHIGAWTQRLAHYQPNEANIPSAFSGEPSSAVEMVKSKYDGTMRSLWSVPEGSWLVGTDAEGIQLRILAHLLRNADYVEAICSGKKEDESDIHNVNKRALLLDHITRDMSKTFIYAFLLGAGFAKVAEILSTPSIVCSLRQAQTAVENFTSSIDGLQTLKQVTIPAAARAGYFTGLDGRKVLQDNSHLILAGMLQSGESIIMKRATTIWQKELDKCQIEYKLCTWPHDEWQTEVTGDKSVAEHVGLVQRNSIVTAGEELELFCPLAGSTDIGRNWNQTH